MDGVDCNGNGHVISLELSSSCLYGSINSSSSHFHLVHLRRFDLSYNHFSFSQIPSTMDNLFVLTHLNLLYSFFVGQIPSEISPLKKLSILNLSYNHLFSPVPNLLAILWFNELNKITYLCHCKNNLKERSHPLLPISPNSTFFLDLSSNDITGHIPIWVMNLTKLNHLDFSLNMLQGSIPISISQPFAFLDISSNRLQGSLLVLSSPIYFYSISKNKLTGKISPMICNMIFLEIPNLLENSLSGKIPKCLGNLSDSLMILNLRRNNLCGTILDT